MIRTEIFKSETGLCRVEINLYDRSYKIFKTNDLSGELYLAINSIHHDDYECKLMLRENGYRALQNVLEVAFQKELNH